jgi:hypothetical protein
MLGNLDNEVIFKKAFTDVFVFEHFVKDILDLDVKIGTIETEKRFTPPVGYVNFALVIFAESKDKRIAIELQRVQYDHNFDRFLHYLMMLLAEQQQSSKQYGFTQTVYLIVVMTQPYKFDDKLGKPVKEEVILTEFDSRNIKGEKVPLWGHQMVVLNPNHPDLETPQRIRDWLDLVYQSIHSPERPNINRNNPGIKRAADLIETSNLDPYEQEERKNAESAEYVRALYEQAGREDVAKNMIAKGYPNALISELTGLSEERVEKLRKEE